MGITIGIAPGLPHGKVKVDCSVLTYEEVGFLDGDDHSHLALRVGLKRGTVKFYEVNLDRIVAHSVSVYEWFGYTKIVKIRVITYFDAEYFLKNLIDADIQKLVNATDGQVIKAYLHAPGLNI